VGDDFKDLFGEGWSEDHNVDRENDKSDLSGGNIPLNGFETSETENFHPRELNEKEVKVSDVFTQQQPGGAPQQHYVLLYDNKGRQVQIWVGASEAIAIKFALEGQATDRPLTHDLIKTALDKLGARVVKVVIDDIWREVFYSKISVMTAEQETLELDARPSDAIAMALRVHAPIFMAEYVLENSVFSEHKE